MRLRLPYSHPSVGERAESAKYPTIIAITSDEIDINKIVAEITLPTTGAVCIFTGTVRGMTSRGSERQTEYLEYEAYQEMAEYEIAAKSVRKFGPGGRMLKGLPWCKGLAR